jgi:peptidoglycan/LPS O-acetylase OafA/YrhL
LTLVAGLSGAGLLALGFRLRLMSRTSAAGAAFQLEPFLLLFAALLLLALQYGKHPLVLRLTRPLRAYGYISYGLYLFHLLGFQVVDRLFAGSQHVPAELTAGRLLLRFCAAFAGTTLVCFISRRYFEEYFLRLKDRLVPYTTPKGAPRTVC